VVGHSHTLDAVLLREAVSLITSADSSADLFPLIAYLRRRVDVVELVSDPNASKRGGGGSPSPSPSTEGQCVEARRRRVFVSVAVAVAVDAG
jgi:hypothetical protein